MTERSTASGTAAADTQTLLDALDRLRDTGPEFAGFLANHGPMAAEAMLRLQAPDRVSGWIDAYVHRLAPAPPPGTDVDETNWWDRLGDMRRLGDWNSFFSRLAAESAWRELLATWWPRLLPGAAASATHGLIRTAHAVRALATAPEPDPLLVDELAHGLALWAARYEYLPGVPSGDGTLGPVAATAQLPRLPADVPSTGPGVSGRLRAAVKVRGLPDALNRWGHAGDDAQALDDLIGAAARVLAAREGVPISFCHAVTAPSAIQMILPELPTDLHRASVNASWQVIGSIVSVFAAVRDPAESDAIDVDPAPLLADLAPRAVEHGDEHVIKLTEAALRHYGRTRDTTVLVAADRFRGRLAPL